MCETSFSARAGGGASSGPSSSSSSSSSSLQAPSVDVLPAKRKGQGSIDRYDDANFSGKRGTPSYLAYSDVVQPKPTSAASTSSEDAPFFVPDRLPRRPTEFSDQIVIAISSAQGAGQTDLRGGAFAGIDIPSGSPVVFFHGKVSSFETLQQKEISFQSGYFIKLLKPYVDEQGRRMYCDGSSEAKSGRCPAAMTNCSTGAKYIASGARVKPNCELRYIDGHPCLFAIRDIVFGEELFWDYGREVGDHIRYPWCNFDVVKLDYELFPFNYSKADNEEVNRSLPTSPASVESHEPLAASCSAARNAHSDDDNSVTVLDRPATELERLQGYESS